MMKNQYAAAKVHENHQTGQETPPEHTEHQTSDPTAETQKANLRKIACVAGAIIGVSLLSSMLSQPQEPTEEELVEHFMQGLHHATMEIEAETRASIPRPMTQAELQRAMRMSVYQL